MIQTEQAILAAVIQENSLVPILLANADKSFFSEAHNQSIYEEIELLYKEGQFFDFVILGDRLRGKISETYIGSLMSSLAHTNIKYLLTDLKLYIDTIKRAKIKIDLLSEIGRQANEPYVDLTEIQRIISNAHLMGTEIEKGSIEECMRELDQSSAGAEEITLGFPSLDKAIGGLRYGELVLFMARTTVGKTFWALNVINNLTSYFKNKIALFSLEMNKLSIIERLGQIRFSLDRESAKEKLKFDEQTRNLFIGTFKNLHIFTQNYSIEEIELKIEETDSKIVFIDYLDLLKMRNSKYQSRYERISDLITESKRIAKRQNSLIVVLHQLQRQAESGSVPVKITMARDSGVVEEVSDFILGAWRPELGYNTESEVPEDMRNRLFIKLLKNKRGPVQKCECIFDHTKTGKLWDVRRED